MDLSVAPEFTYTVNVFGDKSSIPWKILNDQMVRGEATFKRNFSVQYQFTRTRGRGIY